MIGPGFLKSPEELNERLDDSLIWNMSQSAESRAQLHFGRRDKERRMKSAFAMCCRPNVRLNCFDISSGCSRVSHSCDFQTANFLERGSSDEVYDIEAKVH